MVIGPRLQAALLERRGGPSPTMPPRCPPVGSGGSRTAALDVKRSSRPKVGVMAKPHTPLRGSSVDDGRMSGPVATTSDDNLVRTAEASGDWQVVRQSHAMEHVMPFLTAGLAWSNLPRVPQS